MTNLQNSFDFIVHFRNGDTKDFLDYTIEADTLYEAYDLVSKKHRNVTHVHHNGLILTKDAVLIQELKRLQNKAKPIINNRYLFGSLEKSEQLELKEINNKIFKLIDEN
jgi:hypothetical protein